MKIALPLARTIAVCFFPCNAPNTPAACRAFVHMVEEIPRQGRLEGCHRMSAATQLVCRLEVVSFMNE